MAFGARITVNRFRDQEREAKPRGYGGMGQPKVKAGGKRVKGARPGDSKGHLADIRVLPSIISGKPGPSDPHHLKGIGADNQRGMGIKNEDRWAVPLSRDEHNDVEKPPGGDDVAYLMSRWGIDAKAIAEALWRNRGDVPAMHRIIMRDLARRGIAYFGEAP